MDLSSCITWKTYYHYHPSTHTCLDNFVRNVMCIYVYCVFMYMCVHICMHACKYQRIILAVILSFYIVWNRVSVLSLNTSIGLWMSGGSVSACHLVIRTRATHACPHTQLSQALRTPAQVLTLVQQCFADWALSSAPQPEFKTVVVDLKHHVSEILLLLMHFTLPLPTSVCSGLPTLRQILE